MRVRLSVGCAVLSAALMGGVAIQASAADVYEIHGYIASGEIGGSPPTDRGADFVATLEIDRSRAGPSEAHSIFPSPVTALNIQVSYGEDSAQYVHDPSTGSYVEVWDPVAGDPSATDEERVEMHAAVLHEGVPWDVEIVGGAINRDRLPNAAQIPDLTVFPSDQWQLLLRPTDPSAPMLYGRVTSLQRKYAAGATFASDFNTGDLEGWKFGGGAWTTSSGALKSTSNVALSTALIDRDLESDLFRYSLRLQSAWGGYGNTLGLIYNYRDAKNYYQLQLAPNGVARLNEVINGAANTVASANYTGAGAGKWVNVGIQKNAGHTTTITVNGQAIFTDVSQTQLQRGQVGVFTSWNPSKFDDVYFQSGPRYLSGGPIIYPGDVTPVLGSWSVQGDTLSCTSNQSLALALVGRFGGAIPRGAYQYNVRLYSPWGGQGNTAGLVYDYVDAKNFKEVRLSPNRLAYVYEWKNGTQKLIASHAWTGGAKRWVDVALSRFDGNTSVYIDDRLMFLLKQPLPQTAKAGVVSSWNLAKFAASSLADQYLDD